MEKLASYVENLGCLNLLKYSYLWCSFIILFISLSYDSNVFSLTSDGSHLNLFSFFLIKQAKGLF